ncbi:MAG: outer membrane lipoprotein-sorting protein [Pseudomonadota bacterium]
MSQDTGATGGDAPTGLSARFAEMVIRGRWLWFLLAAGLVALSMARIEAIWPPDPSARVFFAPENPDRQALDRFEATFEKDDGLLIVIEPSGGEVFTPRVLAAIGEITEAAWRLPLVRRVDSITNFQHTHADAEGLVVRDLVPDPGTVEARGAAEAKDIAFSRIELVNSFIDPGSSVTMVQVKFVLPGIEPTNEVPLIAREARALADEIEAAHPNLDVRLTGSVMVNNQFATSGQEDGANLIGPMFVVILILVGLALRSAFGALATTVVILLSALSGLGALGWMGLPLNSVTVLAPLYIMTLAVASAVHILSSCRQSMVETPDRREWVRRALTHHAGAITVACLTTAIGFFSLNFSISPPFQQLGNAVGVGIIASLVLVMTLLPSLIILLPIARQTKRAVTSRLMDGIAEFVIRWRRVILPGMSLVVVACIIGVSQIKLEDDFLRYFDERYEFRQDTDFTEDRLTGINTLEFALPSGRASGIHDPAFLAEAEAFASWLREQPEVTFVNALTDILKRLTMNMNDDDPAQYRLPQTEEEASQFLFLYELSLGYGMDLTDRIDVDRETLRLSVLMSRVTTAEMRDLTLRAGGWLEENAPIIQAAWAEEHPELALVTPTGVVHVFNLISYRDVRAMLTGTALALVLISVIITVALRDLRLGAISLLPNLIPALMAFGLWGYGVGAVTLAIAVVLAATLGIVVDDTVHFLSNYGRARRQGQSPEDAVRTTFRSVGMALFVTTVGLVAGFAVLAQSGFAVNGDMAKLTAITIMIALVADFLLLPALLIWLDERKERMSVQRIAATATALVAVLAIAWAAPGSARAETAAEKGLAIAERADQEDLGYGDYEVDGEMVLRDASGKESRRVFENFVMERPDRALGDLGIIVFSRPRDIRGTGLLTHANIEPSDDDQWLYLPAVKRVKRISSSNRTGKFVSSEFSYEDLGSQEIDDYTHEWVRDEPCPGQPSLNCHVVDAVPKNPKSGYSKRTSWTDDQEYRLHQVEFFNRRGDLEKILNFEGYEEYLGQYWRPALMRMVNQQTGKETDLIWTNYRFRVGLSDGDFDQSRLARLAR